MRIIRICTYGAAAVFLGLSTVATAQTPELAKPCVECHGENGVSTDPEIPTIAGASSFFLENQLLIYQESARPCAKEEFQEAEHDSGAEDHCALASELSEDDIAELSQYFADQTFRPADQAFDAALAETGATIHERQCDKCHTEAGTFTLDDAGILAGQWKKYLMGEMQSYRAGERWQPEKMQPKMDELSEDDVKALVEYYAREGTQRWDSEPVQAKPE